MRKLSFESTETTFVVPQRANEDDPGRVQKNYHSGRPKRRENIRTETPASSEDPRETVRCSLPSHLWRKGWKGFAEYGRTATILLPFIPTAWPIVCLTNPCIFPVAAEPQHEYGVQLPYCIVGSEVTGWWKRAS
ncbi:hypothetical protein MGYG_04414 [Nannizzia gypsea CBS 118893]|uniref:Uncharacterized protein n=1 Tax=Arthroderma gypseum (strain ATCC MYA-4604 / CBS 118893) TaxID=535722 RepID=E4USV8_ARTGP|nr:hypothetical protein MGYG_04414 [Nannizzia gypsea CBS 118893]EFR01407.1 hypothetical protein MGYG_04414 [Nannizzia gypsea CBS 118893]